MGVSMSNMIEAAPSFRSTYGEEKAGWMRYVLSSAAGIGMFGIMLWLAS